MKTKGSNTLPIGVFDSGLGGLTVVRELLRRFPDEPIIYLGDNARVPYGTRSAATVEKYARNCAGFLLQQGLKMLVVACNTVSAVAIPMIREMTDIPVLGVIEAGADAVARTGARRVGVIGTNGTITSGAYPLKISEKAPGCRVFQQATPLFVPLAEEGWTDGEVPRAVARHYLGTLVENEIDLLLLGCTHYPLLIETIGTVLNTLKSPAAIVDSATSMADMVGRLLEKTATPDNHRVLTPPLDGLSCFVTDRPASFEGVASRFLGARLGSVSQIDII